MTLTETPNRWIYHRQDTAKTYAGTISRVAGGYQVNWRDKWKQDHTLAVVEKTKAAAVDLLRTVLENDLRG